MKIQKNMKNKNQWFSWKKKKENNKKIKKSMQIEN